MWCHNCGQDAPRVASPETGRQCCLRCGKPVGQEPSAQPHSAGPRAADTHEKGRADELGSSDAARRRPSSYDGWELDEELKHIGRLLGGSARSATGSGRAAGQTHRRFDAAHPTAALHHHVGRARRSASADFDLGTAALGAMVWGALTLGLMASACGGVLLLWSAVLQRDDLWSIGLPVAMVGLLALAVALVMQLDRLSGDHRQTAAKLDQFDSRLLQLRRDAATSAGGTRPPGDAFYAHWADGASPQLLLTDLKSQLELLTHRLGQSEAESVSHVEAD